MKKAVSILILLFISVFMLTGCAKCIDKKEESVKVKIVNEYYKPEETHLIGIINHVPQFRTDYAEYEITVNYNGVEYSLSDESTYRKYHGRIGQTVSAVLVTKTYDDGEVRQYINILIVWEDYKMKYYNGYFKELKNEIVQWIRDWFDQNGPGCNAIVGISGGKDSSVVAALCVEALGKDRVIGVLMPQGQQKDIYAAYKLCEFLDIKSYEINIGDTVRSVLSRLESSGIEISEQTKINLPARIRMSTLYAVSQSCNGRVANTCNLSESYVGYETRYGDSAGDFSPLGKLTVYEVKKLGYELLLPTELIEKIPIDGLCGKTDEDNLGFPYEVLDRYLRTGEIDDLAVKAKIDLMHKRCLFKSEKIPVFNPGLKVEVA